MSTGDETSATLRAALHPRRRPADRAHAVVWAMYAVLAVFAIGYVVVDSLGFEWSWLDGWGVNGFEVVTGLLCILKAADRARPGRPGPGRNQPAVLGRRRHRQHDPVPRRRDAALAVLADGFYVTFYPVAYIALMLLLRANVRRFSLASWLDGAVAGLGAAAVCATFAFKDVLTHAGGSAAGVAVNLAYPVGDVLLLGLVVGGAAIVSGKRRLPWLLLATGYALNTVGDIFNVLGSTSQVATVLNDIAWPVAILLVSISVWVRPRAGRPVLSQEAPGFALPALAAASALLILCVGSVHHVSRVSLALAVATLVIAGVRSALSLVGLRNLTEQRRLDSVTDALTGLGNRRSLSELLDTVAAEHSNRDDGARSLAFMFVDLNKFKEVNDSFGHPSATSCCASSVRACRTRCGARTSSSGWAGTSSRWRCSTPAPTTPPPWRDGSLPRSRSRSCSTRSRPGSAQP